MTTIHNNKTPQEKSKKTKTPTAQKRDLQNKRRREQNKSFKSRVRTAIRSLENSLSAKEKHAILSSQLNQIYSLIDKGVKKGLYKQNKATRIKVRYSKQVKTT